MITFFTNKGFNIVEFLITCCVIFILAGTFGIYANNVLLKTRETALKYELSALRQSLRLYKMLNQKSPEKISEFFDVRKERKNDYGNFLDPFGNKYVYYTENSIIVTTTDGYTEW